MVFICESFDHEPISDQQILSPRHDLSVPWHVNGACFSTTGRGGRPQKTICKWALKHKKNEIARIVRLKARLVARGFSQIYGVDYLDTYASVVKLASIRILLAIAAIYGLEIHQMDVVTAFLAGDLEEEIFMEQPEGFEVGIKEDDLVCRLRRSLYGLKQAPRVWNQRIRLFLKSIGFDQTY